MSGDVQPRKRKDKRRKRDDRKSDGDVSVLRQPSFQDDDESSHGVHITKMGNEDVHLHVHSEHGTGGHWCAKIIFFSLMAILLGLVGLIILENRGLEDLDTPLSESRFSNYFDGWVDEHRVEHDVHEAGHHAIDDHDDHDEHDEHDEEEEVLSEEDHADEDEEADEDEDHAGENITGEDEDEADEEATAEATTEATAEADEEDEEDQDDDEGAEEEIDESIEPPKYQSRVQSQPDLEDEFEEDREDNDDEDDDEQLDEDREDNDEDDEEQLNNDADDNDEDDDDQLEEKEAASVNEDDDKDDEDQFEEEHDKKPEADNDDDDEDQLEDPVDDDDDDFDSLDQFIENDEEELQRQEKERESQASQNKEKDDDDDDDDDNDNDKEEKPEEENSSWLVSVAVKFGVGIALALVSRFVLLRKDPNTTDDEPAPEVIMRRRLTIASAEDQIPDDVEELPPLDDDEYSEEEIEIEEEIEVEVSDIDEAEGESESNVAMSASYVPETFEQLSAMYRGKSKDVKEELPKKKPVPEQVQIPVPVPVPEPEPQPEPEPKPESETEPEGTPSSNIYVEYEDGDIEDYEHYSNDDDDDDDDMDESDEISDEISDVDDAELMSRLEAKYGRLPAKEYESDPDSDDPSWTQIKPKVPKTDSKVNLETDDLFEEELRKANAELIRENHEQALLAFNTIIHIYPHQPVGHLLRAQYLDHLSNVRQNKQLLEDAIESYKRYLAFGELIANDTEYREIGERCIKHLRLMGQHYQAVDISELLIERFPSDLKLRNELSLTLLMDHNLKRLKMVAKETLELWPLDAVARLHYGLAIKQLDMDYSQALPYLQYAIDSQEEGTQEAYFYQSLGETLQRLGRNTEAQDIYQRGADKNLFKSRLQRSFYNEPNLRAKSFWHPSETGYELELKRLQENWLAIRDEALALIGHHGNFADEMEQLRDTGNWQQFELFAQGIRFHGNCQRAPITCNLMHQFTHSTRCRRGQVKFSALQGQTHIWPHCGPTNCRLRAHLTLKSPEPHLSSLRVGEETRTWHEGELLIFDDSFEHEVWHNGTQLRLVLILDMWHPDLSIDQIKSLTAI